MAVVQAKHVRKGKAQTITVINAKREVPRIPVSEQREYENRLKEIAEAEAHLRNAKTWLKAALRGKAPEDYHYSEAVGEAISYLEV